MSSPAAGSTGRRPTWCSRPCATGPPSWGTGAPTSGPAPTARPWRGVDEPLEVVQPTSWAALHLVNALCEERDIARLPARGYATSRADFATWASGRARRRLLMEDFYRDSRRRLGLLMEGPEPEGGRWNFDADNREPPPRGRDTLGVPEPRWPVEDEIDAQVRGDLDRWAAEGVAMVGEDGPRLFAATRTEALAALDDFVEHRLPAFGRHEDAVMGGDRWMAHSMLSAPMNLGLLDPVEVAQAAEDAYRARGGTAGLGGGLRPPGRRLARLRVAPLLAPRARTTAGATSWARTAPYRRGSRTWTPPGRGPRACRSALTSVRETGWTHHIPRLMVLGNYAQQRGWDPAAVTDWFHRSFVDGYDWVMVPNVVGMSQHADGGVMATKPYVAGGNYLATMTDHCGGCVFDPKIRVGERACPMTAGYWLFLARHRERFEANPRMRQAVRGLDRLKDLDRLLAEHAGAASPTQPTTS